MAKPKPKLYLEYAAGKLQENKTYRNSFVVISIGIISFVAISLSIELLSFFASEFWIKTAAKQQQPTSPTKKAPKQRGEAGIEQRAKNKYFTKWRRRKNWFSCYSAITSVYAALNTHNVHRSIIIWLFYLIIGAIYIEWGERFEGKSPSYTHIDVSPWTNYISLYAFFCTKIALYGAMTWPTNWSRVAVSVYQHTHTHPPCKICANCVCTHTKQRYWFARIVWCLRASARCDCASSNARCGHLKSTNANFVLKI